MSFIGKMLVLLFTGVSLMCLAWGAMVYSQRFDYAPTVDQAGKKSPGRLDQSIKLTNDLLYANNRAYTRWSQNYDELLQAENNRLKRHDFCKRQIEILLSGVTDGMKQSAQEAPESTDGTGLISLDKPTGRTTIKVNGKELETIPHYQKGLQSVAEAVPVIIKDIEGIKEELVKTTDAITGVKGLRARIKEQDRLEELATAETRYLDDFITNRHAEAQLFFKRRTAMEARVKELKQFYHISH